MRVFIYGSCVSRDTFEHLDPQDFELVDYVARQSLISAAAPATATPIPNFDTRSPFQERMLRGDWASSLFQTLREQGEQIDLLVWDLCDERLGVRQLDALSPQLGKPMATRSVDGIRTGLDEQLLEARLVPFGSRQHRLLFLHSLRQFSTLLRDLGLQDRTILLAPDWAHHDTRGGKTPSSFGLAAKRANRLFADYYAAAAKVTGVHVVRLSSDIQAAPHHVWGPAPFHYTEQVYAKLCGAIQQHAETVRQAQEQRMAVHRYRPDGSAEPIGDVVIPAITEVDTPEARYLASKGAIGDPPEQHWYRSPAGYIFGRSGWGQFEQDADRETFYSVLGGDSGSTHDDAGAVTYTSRGITWFTDPGQHLGSPMDRHLASRSAHNVVEIMGADRNLQGGVRIQHAHNSDSFDDLLLLDDSYDGVTIERRVVFHRGGEFLVVIDTITSEERIKAVQRWQLSPGLHASLDEDGYLISHATGTARIAWAGVRPYLSTETGTSEPPRGWVATPSPDGSLAPATQITALRGGVQSRFVTVLGIAPQGILKVKYFNSISGGQSLLVTAGRQDYPLMITRKQVEARFVAGLSQRTPTKVLLLRQHAALDDHMWERSLTPQQAITHARAKVNENGSQAVRKQMAAGLSRMLTASKFNTSFTDPLTCALIDVVGTHNLVSGWRSVHLLPQRRPVLATPDSPIPISGYKATMHDHRKALDLLASGTRDTVVFSAKLNGDQITPWVARPGKGSTLIVRLQGAVNRTKVTVPFLPSLTFSQAEDHPFLIIQDPSMDLDQGMNLSWYLGSYSADGHALVTSLIEEVRSALSLEHVLLVGSSGGGFAALQIAALLDGSSALAFNPQTDLRNYIPSATRRAAQACKGKSSIYDVDPPLVSVSERYARSKHPAIKAHVVSNIGDSHDRMHVIPLEEAVAEFPHVSLSVERVDWGSGHVAPDNKRVREAIHRQLKEQASPSH